MPRGRPTFIAGMSPRMFQLALEDAPFEDPPLFGPTTKSNESVGFLKDGPRSSVVVLRRAFLPNYFWFRLTDTWSREHTLPAPLHFDDWPKLREFWELEDHRWQHGTGLEAGAFPFTYPRAAKLKEERPRLFFATLDTQNHGPTLTYHFSALPPVTVKRPVRVLAVAGPLLREMVPLLNSSFAIGAPGAWVPSSPELLEAIAEVSANFARKCLFTPGVMRGFEGLWMPHDFPPALAGAAAQAARSAEVVAEVIAESREPAVIKSLEDEDDDLDLEDDPMDGIDA